MNVSKNNRVRMIKGVELMIKRERHQSFYVWQREDGTFVQTNTCRRELWNRKGIAFVKVTSVMTTFKQVIPGTSDDRDLIEQTLIGTTEHIDKYLGDLSGLSGVRRTDNGATIEATI